MNCKPGDLAIIIGCQNPRGKHHIGKIITVVRESRIYKGHWRVEPETYGLNTTTPMCWADFRLKPILPGDLNETTDERKEVTA